MKETRIQGKRGDLVQDKNRRGKTGAKKKSESG